MLYRPVVRVVVCRVVLSRGSCRVRRAQYAGQVHRVVPQRDHAAGAVAAPLPAWRLHTLQGNQGSLQLR